MKKALSGIILFWRTAFLSFPLALLAFVSSNLYTGWRAEYFAEDTARMEHRAL